MEAPMISEAPIAPPRPLVRDRIAGAFVLTVLAVACLAFWTVVPLGALWLFGRATDASTTHYLVGLLGVPLAMGLCAPALFWLNGLYLRVSGVLAQVEAEARETGWRRRVAGPLEPLLLLSLAIAVIALCVWFFGYADNSAPFMV